VISDDDATALFGIAFEAGSFDAASGNSKKSGAVREKGAPVKASAEKRTGGISYDQACKTIREYLSSNKKITTPAATELLCVSGSRARNLLGRMAKDRILKTVGKTKGRYYRLMR
jgi:predicted HTH transcriptional regulator